MGDLCVPRGMYVCVACTSATSVCRVASGMYVCVATGLIEPCGMYVCVATGFSNTCVGICAIGRCVDCTSELGLDGTRCTELGLDGKRCRSCACRIPPGRNRTSYPSGVTVTRSLEGRMVATCVGIVDASIGLTSKPSTVTVTRSLSCPRCLTSKPIGVTVTRSSASCDSCGAGRL